MLIASCYRMTIGILGIISTGHRNKKRGRAWSYISIEYNAIKNGKPFWKDLPYKFCFISSCTVPWHMAPPIWKMA